MHWPANEASALNKARTGQRSFAINCAAWKISPEFALEKARFKGSMSENAASKQV